MRRTKEEAEQTRQDLMKAAERVFSKHGFAATRLSDIAEEANVTRGAIYYHFGNKMKLFVALHKERVDPYVKMLNEMFELDIPPKQKIKRIFTELLQRALNDIDFIIKQRFDIFRDIEFKDCEELHEFMMERSRKFYNQLVEILRYGQGIGDIRQDISPDLAAFNLLTYLKGLVAVLIMEKETTFIKDRVEELIETALKGF
jgi:AcrR family transcriptional regulator